MKTLILAKIQNDAFWLDEWIEWHLSLGNVEILLFDINKGKTDYPMSDYAIMKCAEKKVKVKNFRNRDVSLEDEIKKTDRSKYSFAICIGIDEYIAVCENETFDSILEKNKKSLSLKVVPFSLNDGAKKIALERYGSYSDIKLECLSSFSIGNCESIFIEKYFDRTKEEWKKHIEMENEDT